MNYILTQFHYKGDTMKILLSVMSIVMVLSLSSCKETNEKPKTQTDPQTQTKQTPVQRVAPAAGTHTAVVSEVIHTTSYTYLKVKEASAEIWLAIPKKDVKVGETISYQNPMEMTDFKSKELNRTFESVFFLGGVTSQSDSAPNKKPNETAPVAKVAGGFLVTADTHTVVIQQVIDTDSYTYLKVKEADVEAWLAISKSQMAVGETITFQNPMEMREFKSKTLNKTFEVIYFLGKVTKTLDADGKVLAVDTPKAVESKEPVVKKIEKINIAPVEGGISIGDLFEKRDSYNGKVIQIKGKVVKFSKSIMGKNWVHLQDGTGKAGTKKTATNDLLVTTQEVVEVDDVVTFQGMIVLKKDFGAGYSYEVLMEMGKKQK
jgi:hypothetical protein